MIFLLLIGIVCPLVKRKLAATKREESNILSDHQHDWVDSPPSYMRGVWTTNTPVEGPYNLMNASDNVSLDSFKPAYGGYLNNSLEIEEDSVLDVSDPHVNLDASLTSSLYETHFSDIEDCSPVTFLHPLRSHHSNTMQMQTR